MFEPHEQLITISTKTILKIVIIGLLLWFLWFIRDIVFAFFVALLLASLIDPIADFCGRKKIPRGVTALCVFLLLGGLIALVITLVVPLIIAEGSSFIGNFSQLWIKFVDRADIIKQFAERAGLIENISQTSGSLEPAIVNTMQGLFSTITGIFHGIFTVVLIVVLTFYLVVQENVVRDFWHIIAPDNYRPFIAQLIKRIKERLGNWLRGQLFLSLIIGVMVYIGLLILGVDYALLLAIIAAFFEVIPYVGPTLAAIPPVFIAFAQNPNTPVPALIVIALFVIIQQIENHFLVPKVMQKAVGLNPIVSIISIVVGVKLAGIIGGLLAIPAMTSVQVIIESLQTRNDKPTM